MNKSSEGKGIKDFSNSEIKKMKGVISLRCPECNSQINIPELPDFGFKKEDKTLIKNYYEAGKLEGRYNILSELLPDIFCKLDKFRYLGLKREYGELAEEITYYIKQLKEKYSDDVNDITVALQRIKELEKTLDKLNNL